MIIVGHKLSENECPTIHFYKLKEKSLNGILKDHRKVGFLLKGEHFGSINLKNPVTLVKPTN